VAFVPLLYSDGPSVLDDTSETLLPASVLHADTAAQMAVYKELSAAVAVPSIATM